MIRLHGWAARVRRFWAWFSPKTSPVTQFTLVRRAVGRLDYTGRFDWE